MESTELDVSQAGALFAEMFSDDPAEDREEKPEAELAEEGTTEPVEGDEEAQLEGETESDALEEPQTFTVKIDGKEVEVSLDELKAGYQRQTDYTKKTMEAAELRKTADAERQKTIGERQQYAQNLQQQHALVSAALHEQSQTNWQELIDSDPVEYLKQQHLFQQRQAALQRINHDAAQFQQNVEAEQKQESEKFLKEQHDLLVAKFPEWKDAEKAKAGKAAIRDYLMNIFDAEEVSGVSDHRLVLLADKARRFDEMVAKAKTVQKKVENIPQRIQRSGNGANPQIDKRTSAYQRLSKTGSVEDAGRLFASLL